MSTTSSRTWQQLRGELTASPLLSTLVAGLLAGFLTVLVQLSYAALLFAGPLEARMAEGIGLTLAGGVVFGVVVALTTRLPAVVALSQDMPVAILAALSVSIVTAGTLDTDAAFSTVVAVVVLTSLVTGLAFILLGKYRLGRLVRFLPYPVIGGFLALTGWLLLQGGMNVMTGSGISLSHLATLLQPGMVANWLPGLTLSAALVFTVRRYRHPLLITGVLAAATLFFFVGLAVAGVGHENARAAGWLLGPFPDSRSLWQPPFPALLGQVDWITLAQSLPYVASVTLLGLVAFLLNASALEVALQQDVDLNRELQIAGASNLLAGLGGAPMGFHSVSLTLLGRYLGTTSRLVGVFSGLMCAAVLFFGASVLLFVPRFLLGGLVAYLGLNLLVDWLYDGWFRLSRSDYAIVVLILLVAATVGYLEGVMVGILVAGIVFVINYSRSDVVVQELTGASFRSAVDRSPAEEQMLRQMCDRIQILRLQGYLFFGTADSLRARVRNRVRSRGESPVDYLVLDFKAVHGLDSSAVQSFIKIRQLAEKAGLSILLCNLSPRVLQAFSRAQAPLQEDAAMRVMPDVDQAVEWCEEQILARLDPQTRAVSATFREQVASVCATSAELDTLIGFFECQEVGANTVLMQQGAPAQELYFVESGQARVLVQQPGDQPLRIRTIGPGAIIGELGMFLAATRSATVITSQPSVLYRLSAAALQEMQETAPEAAILFYRLIAQNLSQRVIDTTERLRGALSW